MNGEGFWVAVFSDVRHELCDALVFHVDVNSEQVVFGACWDVCVAVAGLEDFLGVVRWVAPLAGWLFAFADNLKLAVFGEVACLWRVGRHVGHLFGSRCLRHEGFRLLGRCVLCRAAVVSRGPVDATTSGNLDLFLLQFCRSLGGFLCLCGGFLLLGFGLGLN